MLKNIRDNNNHKNNQPSKLNNQLTNQSNIFNTFNWNIRRNKYKLFRIALKDIRLKQINLKSNGIALNITHANWLELVG